jgi:hypothetical protein
MPNLPNFSAKFPASFRTRGRGWLIITMGSVPISGSVVIEGAVPRLGGPNETRETTMATMFCRSSATPLPPLWPAAEDSTRLPAVLVLIIVINVIASICLIIFGIDLSAFLAM